MTRLENRAREIRETRTGLAERYVEEGLRMDEHPGIGFADGPAGRRAIVLGTGLDVWEVVSTVQQSNGRAEEAAAYLAVPINVIRVAMRYYASYPAAIDDWLARQDAIAEREQAAFEREQRPLR